MKPDAPNINHYWAQLIIEELIRQGVDQFCLAPGSRSTPLTTAVARHPAAREVVHVDERGTSFFATGYARATGQPAVWITTSGTAVANGLPAVVEAAADHLPLILLTADRPPELRETGANQTIDQVKIFGDYVRHFFDLPAPDDTIDPAMVLTTVDQMVHRTRSKPQGPVHLNCMFRKPLEPSPGPYEPAEKDRLRRWRNGSKTYTGYSRHASKPAQDLVGEIAETVDAGTRGLIAAGRLSDPETAATVSALADKLRWPLLPDIGSQLRLAPDRATTIPYFDLLLANAPSPEGYAPDTVVYFGDRGASKRLRRFLTEYPPDEHIVVKDHPERLDIDHAVTRSVEADIGAFASALSSAVGTGTNESWMRRWREGSDTVGSALNTYTASSGLLREPRVVRVLTQHLPEAHGLFLASSRPVRDANSFGAPGDVRVRVGANRGASGIDGTIASAAGFSQGLGQAATLLIGDLATLHDLNALSLARTAPFPLVIVVINNNGGGIFSFLPIAEHPDIFEKYFATPGNVSFDRAASMFDLSYARPSSIDELVTEYRSAVKRSESTIIEIVTDREENLDEHRQLHAAVAEALNDDS